MPMGVSQKMAIPPRYMLEQGIFSCVNLRTVHHLSHTSQNRALSLTYILERVIIFFIHLSTGHYPLYTSQNRSLSPTYILEQTGHYLLFPLKSQHRSLSSLNILELVIISYKQCILQICTYLLFFNIILKSHFSLMSN